MPHRLGSVVRVGSFGCFLEFAIGLLEQILGFLSVSAQIEFVGLLCRYDLLERLRGQPLGRGDIGVSCRTDIVGGTRENGTCSKRESASTDEHTDLLHDEVSR